MLKVQELREIIQLIDESSINEFVYESNGSAVTIKKTPENSVTNNTQGQVVTQPVVEQVVKATPVQETTPVQKDEGSNELEQDESLEEILSPMVGTFYRKPSPESEFYVEVGSQVTNESIVCIVEAMKLFNEIEAEINGEIVEILVTDGELVEFGQPLFKVKTK